MATIARHKFASSDYEIFEKYEAGIELKGWEVKSIRSGNVSLKNSFCNFKYQELFWSNANISNWMNEKNDSFRPRKLLLHKKELIKISFTQQKYKCLIIPISLYWSGGNIKIEIAVARKRSKYDKRQTIKQDEENKKLLKIKKDYL